MPTSSLQHSRAPFSSNVLPPPTIESSDPELQTADLTYFCDVTSKRDYFMLWPFYEWHISKIWSSDQLFAFLSEFEASWHIHDAAGWFCTHLQYPDGYFQLIFDFDNESHPIYASAILVMVPNIWTHCIAQFSRDWLEKPPGEWTREICIPNSIRNALDFWPKPS
jgi:hypothetical protein